MTGTFINIGTVLAGGTLGMLFGARLPERVRETIVAGLGLFTAAIGVILFIESENPIVVLAGLLIGGLIGELGRIEDGLRGVGAWLEEKFSRQTLNRVDEIRSSSWQTGDEIPLGAVEGQHNEIPRGSRFVRGFLTASLVFCIGPMTILGSIQDGLTGNYSLLAIKSVLDGFAALAFASIFGMGVLFSILVILLYQGGITLLAAQAKNIISEPMMAEMTAVGGVLLLGLAISSLLEIKPIRVGNFLPALLVAPLIVAVLDWLKWW